MFDLNSEIHFSMDPGDSSVALAAQMVVLPAQTAVHTASIAVLASQVAVLGSHLMCLRAVRSASVSVTIHKSASV